VHSEEKWIKVGSCLDVDVDMHVDVLVFMQASNQSNADAYAIPLGRLNVLGCTKTPFYFLLSP
jgi:hypothetical protein